MSSELFRGLVEAKFPSLNAEQVDRVVQFRELVLEENKVQNLTRITEPEEFVEGHLIDAVILMNSGLVDYPAMDLGSGVGVPGLLCAVLGSGPWVLAESEGRKAEFLIRAARELGLDNVTVFSGRAEDYLKTSSVKSIVARAIGPVERIFGWIRHCSTWNNLVLLKGKGWDEELARFHISGSNRKALTPTKKTEYSVGIENKQRVIIRLERSQPSR